MFWKLHINTAQLLLWPELTSNSNCCSPSLHQGRFEESLQQRKEQQEICQLGEVIDNYFFFIKAEWHT